MTSGNSQCPLCSRQGSFLLRGPDRLFGVHPEIGHALNRCDSCDLCFAEPISDELLMDFYPEPYYQVAPATSWRSLVRRARVSNRARALTSGLDPGRALDIGCGRGHLLEELAARGWGVAGTDWNPDNAREVSERLGLEVAGGPDAMESFPDASFDVVSLFHVLEHTDEPLVMLRDVWRVLKPGGRLVIVVPNARSASRALFGRHWCGYDLPRHRSTFTPKSLGIALERCGFSLEKTSGRFSDEMLEVHDSAGLVAGTSGSRRPGMQVIVAAVAFAAILPARALGYPSVLCAYATKA